MTSEIKTWKIDKIANKAKRNINSLSSKYQNKVIDRFERLEKNPFDNVVKAEGKENIFRGRIGNYRFYFRVNFTQSLIEIVLFDHKSNIKRKTIQKL
jgi:mRNA-degrading endonuclease RelE of RelBE toxin-antitoxin system